MLVRRVANMALGGILPSLSSSLSSLQPTSLGCPYSSLTRRRRKEMRKSSAASQRELLDFAKLFDPLRTARAQVFQTLEYLGWECLAGELVEEGLVVDFTFLDTFVALEVVEGSAYVLPGDAEASTDVGYGPGVQAPSSAAATVAPSGRVLAPSETAFFAAPPSWLSPVRGLVLNKATAARHAAIRAKGWKLVAVPEPLWAFAAGKQKDAHYARRDLLMSLVLPQLPFEPRPENTLRGAQRKVKAGAKAAGESAAALIGVKKDALEAPKY
jgi:hypothetical protein